VGDPDQNDKMTRVFSHQVELLPPPPRPETTAWPTPVKRLHYRLCRLSADSLTRIGVDLGLLDAETELRQNALATAVLSRATSDGKLSSLFKAVERAHGKKDWDSDPFASLENETNR